MKIGVVLVFVLMIGFSAASLGDDWDSFSNGSESEDLVPDDDLSSVNEETFDNNIEELHREVVYTDDFYLALGVGFVGILIVLLFAYLFFRKPKNRWKKKRS